MGEEEDNYECTELGRGELLDGGEDGREGEVEGSEGGDGPGGDGEGGAHLWLWIPHVGHSQGEYPPEICIREAINRQIYCGRVGWGCLGGLSRLGGLVWLITNGDVALSTLWQANT